MGSNRLRSLAPRLFLAALFCGIAPAASAASLTYTNLPTSVTTYTDINAQATVSGLTPPFTFSVSLGTLPAGLSLDPATGAITGTPATWPGGTFVIQAKDGSGGTATFGGFLNIAPPIASQFNVIPDGASSFNPASGEAAQSLVLLNMGGSPPLTFTIYYSPFLQSEGVSSGVGLNFASNYDAKLTLSPTQAVVKLPNGRTIVFQRNGSSFVQQGPSQFNANLITASTVPYLLFDGQTFLYYGFSTTGTLISIVDKNGNQVSVTSGSAGPTQVTGPSGSLSFIYGTSGLNSVTDSAGEQVSFAHSLNRLTSITLPDATQIKFTYNTNGVMNGWTDQNNNTSAITVDSLSRVTQFTDALGDQTKNSFSGSITLITDPNQNQTTVDSVDSLAPIKITDALNNSTSLEVDSKFQIKSITDPNGNQAQETYDAQSNYVATLTDPLGGTYTLSYTLRPQGSTTVSDLSRITFADNTNFEITRDTSGNPLTVTDPGGFVRTNAFTAQGFLSSETNPAGGKTTYLYDAHGNETDATDPAGNHISFSFNPANLPIKSTLPDGKTISITWDQMHRPLTVTDENGGVLTTVYDSTGRITSQKYPGGELYEYAYDGASRLIQVSSPLLNTTKYSYDAAGNEIQTTLPDGGRITTAYNALNLPVTVTDATGTNFGFAYDAARNLTGVTDGLSHTWGVTRDANGNVTGITSPLLATSSFSLNSINQVQSCTDPRGNASNFSYDARGPLTGITLGGAASGLQARRAGSSTGLSTSFTYDSLGFLASRTDPNGNTWTIQNDNSGRVSSTTDPLNRSASFTHDARNRLSGSTNPLGSVQISYDGVGNETQRKYSDGTTFNYSYDADNHLTSGTGVALSYDADGNVTGSNGLAMTSDPLGRIASVTYAAGKTVTYAYDAGGKLTKISDWAGGSVAFSYDAAGQLTSAVRSNGIATRYAYDADGHVKSIAESSGTQSVAGISYQRDAAGNITSEARNEPQVFAPAAGVAAFTYDAAEQISSAGYSSDSLGRVTKTPQGTLTWNLASDLTAYNIAGQSAQFGYDALGLRTSATPAAGSAQTYVINYRLGLPSVATVKSGGADQRYYIYSPDGALLYAIDATGSAHHFYHFDDAGTTTFLSNDQGQVTDSYAVGPYGEDLVATGSTPNPFTWMGRWGVMQEGSTGLYYMRARYYDSTSGRFLSTDPVNHRNPLNASPYVYAASNPISNADPGGAGDDDDDLLGICIGAGGGSFYSVGLHYGWRSTHASNKIMSLIEDLAWSVNSTIDLVSRSFRDHVIGWAAGEGGDLNLPLWRGYRAGAIQSTVSQAGRDFEDTLSIPIAALNTEAGLLGTVSTVLKWGGKAAAVIGTAIQVVTGAVQDYRNGLGWFLTLTDIQATVISAVATYLTPGGGPLDLVTAGSISGGVHNLLFIPNATAKIVAFRTTSQEQTAIKKVLTRPPLIKAAWGLVDRALETSAGQSVVNFLAAGLSYLPNFK